LSRYAPGKIGSSGLAEPKFLTAVTGKNLTFRDGMRLGQKSWNLDHALAWDLDDVADELERNGKLGKE
jgi:hypothetical protein